MIDFNRLTEQAQKAILQAQEILPRFQNVQLDCEHLLLAMINQEKGLTISILNSLNTNIDALTEDVEKAIHQKPKGSYSPDPNQFFITPNFKRLIDSASEEAERLKDSYISLEHILI